MTSSLGCKTQKCTTCNTVMCHKLCAEVLMLLQHSNVSVLLLCYIVRPCSFQWCSCRSELSMCTRRQDQDVAFELAYWKMTYKFENLK